MDYQVQENCLTIFLPKEVDHHNAEEIRKSADSVIEKNHIKYVIFDFKDTVYGQLRNRSNNGTISDDTAYKWRSVGGTYKCKN